MKKQLHLFRALVAYVVFGNASCLTLQAPVQAAQQALGGRGLGQGFPGSLGGSFGRGGDGSGGLFSGGLGDNPSRGLHNRPGGSLGSGLRGINPGGYPTGIGDGSSGGVPGFGSGSDGSRGSMGPGGLGLFGGAPSLSGRLGRGSLPGLQGEREPSTTHGAAGDAFGTTAGNSFGSGGSNPGQQVFDQGTAGGSASQAPASPPGVPMAGGSAAGPELEGSPLGPAASGVGGGSSATPLGNPSTTSSGASGASSTGGPGVSGSTAIGAPGAGPGSTGSLPSGGRLSTNRRPGKPRGPLSPAEAAAVGLGVTGGILALSALGAGIATLVQQKKKLNPKPQGCTESQTPQSPKASGRNRRSILHSKVPADILDGIPMDFERLY